MWISLDLHNRDNEHLVEDKLWKHHGPTNSLDHGKQRLHHDKKKLHDHAQQERQPPCQQLGNIYGLTKSLDHEKPHERHDRDVNDLHDLKNV